MTIKEIEVLTENEIKVLKNEGKAELLNIKEHNCYFVNLGDVFGYSVLVFKNNHHIYYANDYQLHHNRKTIEELKEWYIKTLNDKLFTESELMENVQNYEEYVKKSYYVRNLWIMQVDYITAFHIGKRDEQTEAEMKKMFFCSTCFCYVLDKNIVELSYNFINHIQKSFSKVKNEETVFCKMISFELANHEAGYTCDYKDTLDNLGLKFEDLTDKQKKIVKEELTKQIKYVV